MGLWIVSNARWLYPAYSHSPLLRVENNHMLQPIKNQRFSFHEPNRALNWNRFCFNLPDRLWKLSLTFFWHCIWPIFTASASQDISCTFKFIWMFYFNTNRSAIIYMPIEWQTLWWQKTSTVARNSFIAAAISKKKQPSLFLFCNETITFAIPFTL